MKKTFRFIILVAMALAMALPFSKPLEVKASDDGTVVRAGQNGPFWAGRKRPISAKRKGPIRQAHSFQMSNSVNC